MNNVNNNQLDKQIMINKLNRMIKQTEDHPYYSEAAKRGIVGMWRGLLWEIEAGKYDWRGEDG